MTSSLMVRRGGLYVSAETYACHFAGIDAVVLLRRDDDLVILPVHHAAAGGYLLKRRNAKGDRVVHAADFFRRHGIEDSAELRLMASWNSAAAGLLAVGAFRQEGLVA
jgi:hypothetical protein